MPPAKDIVRIAAVGDVHYTRAAAQGSLMRELYPARPFRIFDLDTSATGDDRRTGSDRRAVEPSMGNS